MVEISKADWKLFRERIGNWQERYMEKLSKEYVKLLTSPGNASDHFWELEKRIKQDKKHPGVLIEINMGKAIWDINRRFGRDGVRTLVCHIPADLCRTVLVQHPCDDHLRHSGRSND